MGDETFRVLLIDDNPRDRALVKGGLEKLLAGIKHEIVEANDSGPGLRELGKAKAAGAPFELVVTDYMLSFGNGVDNVLRPIRQEYKDDVPVVVISMSPDPMMNFIISDYGGKGMLYKEDVWSGNSKEFKEIVENAVKAKQNTGQAQAGSAGGQTPDQKEHHHDFAKITLAFGGLRPTEKREHSANRRTNLA